MESRYEIVLRLKELASRGMAAEVVEEINVIDPTFFTQNSHLLFQLKQVCRSHYYILNLNKIHFKLLSLMSHGLLHFFFPARIFEASQNW